MFVAPETIIKLLDILPGMKVADFGAGAGFYALAIAKRVGPSGKVFALDIRKEMLEVIRSRAREQKLLNVEAIWADLEAAEGSHLKENSIDFVIVSNVLFQVENRKGLAARRNHSH